MRVVRQLAIFLQQLRRIATSPAIDPIELLTTLGAIVITAATPTVVVVVIISIVIQG
jgi:hypothetical protein